MIDIQDVSKTFEDINALDDLSMKINKGEIFGLVGTNGSGKSTLLRLIAGVLKPDAGSITIDGEGVYENEAIKSQICFLSDTGFTPSGATPLGLAKTYSVFYPDFDLGRFKSLLDKIGLGGDRKLRGFSKGMKKQVSVLLGICTNTKILLCDETFDGLDPVMRQTVKGLFATEMLDRDFTPVIASHNLRELEDICDRVGLLHDGCVVYADDLLGMKSQIHKLQCVPGSEEKERKLLGSIKSLKTERHGTMLTIVCKGEREEILKAAEAVEPVYCELVALSFEEIFIDEMEVAGYEFKDLFS